MEGAEGGARQSRSSLKEVLRDTDGSKCGEMLAARTDEYLLAARGVGYGDGTGCGNTRPMEDISGATRRRTIPFLKAWSEATGRNAVRAEAVRLKDLILQIIDEKKTVDKKNEITLGLNPERRDLAAQRSCRWIATSTYSGGICLRRRLRMPAERARLRTGFIITERGRSTASCRACGGITPHFFDKQVKTAKAALPEKYPFLQTIADKKKIEEATF